MANDKTNALIKYHIEIEKLHMGAITLTFMIISKMHF